MPKVRDILQTKGTHVHSITPEASVLEAAQLMNEHKIGSLVVMDREQVVGIITERDILQRLVAKRRDPADTAVHDAMTTAVVCCRTDTTLDEARWLMKERRVRHLPVLDDERHLLGLISIGDLNAYLSHDQTATIHVLEEFIYGRN